MPCFEIIAINNPILESEHKIPLALHGVFGATAGALAILAVHPADLIKTRMQLLGLQKGKRASFHSVLRSTIKNEGFRGLYRGLSCAIFRQYTYGLTRFGVFYTLLELHKTHYGTSPNVFGKIGLGMTAGFMAAFVGNPADVALIRMTADGMMPPEKRRGYTHVFNALYRISKEEGVSTLWRGVEATVTRAMVMTTAEMVAYTQTHETLGRYLDEGILLHFCASMACGLCGCTCGLPVDIIKTRVQNATRGEGQITILRQILRNEGVLALWTGFLPMYVKMGPRAVFTFVIFEQLKILYIKTADILDGGVA